MQAPAPAALHELPVHVSQADSETDALLPLYLPAPHAEQVPEPVSFPALYVPGGHASQTPPDSV